MNRKGPRLALTLLMVLCLVSPVQAETHRASPSTGRMRALLIGCDNFVSQQDTWPAAENNLNLLADALLTDSRGYTLIRYFPTVIATVERFRAEVESAFQGARPEDVSLLYLSTHGFFDEGTSNASASLLLSDGQTEERLDAATLEEILDGIPGKKVLILDFCNSGAFIGKGLSGGAARVFFSGPDYKVLCSAGGSEASWYWQGTEDAVASGASYFATVLADALGAKGDHGADANLDGRVTLKEAYAYLFDNYAASTPQVYPQDDGEFVLYAYHPQDVSRLEKAVTDITFEDTVLSAGQSEITFSFTVHRQVELYYQVVYHQNGAWQFEAAQHFLDGEQLDGTVLPGRKRRTLSLDTGASEAYGYAMIQFITREGGNPTLQGARLLCVQPAAGTVKLSVITDPAFIPGIGQELCILAQHDVPCGLTVTVLDADGETVRRLAYLAPSRPQQLSPAASTYYWDGRRTSGEMAEPGQYTVQVQTTLGETPLLCESLPFELIDQDRAG